MHTSTGALAYVTTVGLSLAVIFSGQWCVLRIAAPCQAAGQSHRPVVPCQKDAGILEVQGLAAYAPSFDPPLTQ